MTFPLITPELALRVGRSEADHVASWLEAICGEEASSPFDGQIRRFGSAVALRSSGRDGATLGPLFNRVLCFGDAEAHLLEDIVSFYTERSLPCRIDVLPYAVSTQTLHRLIDHGFYPLRHHDHLYGVPQHTAAIGGDASPGTSDVIVREISPDDQAIWADVWQRGFLEVSAIDPIHHQRVAMTTAKLCRHDDWTLYLAFVQGEAAGAAGLHVKDGVGTLAFAGTLPEYRRRGCQRALLQARLAGADARRCDLIAAQAALGAVSHHSMERAGLRVAYTRALWVSSAKQ